METIVTTKFNRLAILHRIGNAFGFKLELKQNGTAINLSANEFEFYIIDARSNVLYTATVGDGLLLTDSNTRLAFALPIDTLDTLTQATKYELHILAVGGNTPIIQGPFNVVDPLHQPALTPDISGTTSLVTVTQNIGEQIIEVSTGHIFGLELKADLVDGKVPASQLPSFVDDVVDYANLAAFPTTGEASKIYVTLDTNLTYRWTGTAYVQISDSTAIWGQISGNLALQTDLQAAFTAINASIAGKYDNSNPAGYITSAALNGYATQTWVDGKGFLVANDLNGYATQNWVNTQGFALASSLSVYVPYTGATTSLNLGTNNLILGTATGAGRIKLPDAGTTSADGIAFGDYFIFRSGLQTLSLNSGSATWTFSNAIFSAPTNQSSTFRIGGARTLTFDNGLGGTIMSLNSSSGTTTIRGNSASTGTALLVQNSTPTDILTVLNTGRVGIWFSTPSARLSIGSDGGYDGALSVGNVGATSGRIAMIGSMEIVTNGNPSWSGQGFSIAGASRTFEFIASYLNLTDDSLFRFRTGSTAGVFGNPTSGDRIFASIGMASGTNRTTFSPTSGNANYTVLYLTSVINQTGGANGVTRGILIAPTLTAAADYRAIEVITGDNGAHTMLRLNNGTQDVLCVKGNNKAGFFGKITGQANMPAASASAAYTSTEQKMLNDVYTAVRDFGIGN